MIAEFESRIGRQSIGNVVASGTAVIDELGPLHMETGYPIVYTSADSVFQIAAHEGIVPVPQLYKWCDVAYDLAVKGLGLGRVIARPFIGLPGSFQRTANRHDYAMPPIAETLLDRMVAAGQHVAAVGKVSDLFAGRGISESHPTEERRRGRGPGAGADGDAAQRPDLRQPGGLRYRSTGIATTPPAMPRNLERFDARLPRLLAKLRDDDLLVITADHGNDPTTPSTDHSREHVPVLLHGRGVKAGVDLGTRSTFADLGQTLAENFGVGPLAARHELPAAR